MVLRLRAISWQWVALNLLAALIESDYIYCSDLKFNLIEQRWSPCGMGSCCVWHVADWEGDRQQSGREQKAEQWIGQEKRSGAALGEDKGLTCGMPAKNVWPHCNPTHGLKGVWGWLKNIFYYYYYYSKKNVNEYIMYLGRVNYKLYGSGI